MRQSPAQRAAAALLLISACAAAHAAEPLPSLTQRRAGAAVMVHRGSLDFAVENTLAAVEAAFLTGGDGVEIDIRRTADDTLILMHDPWVDRVLDAYGPVDRMTYEELLLYHFREPYGLTRPDERVPTLREVFALCKRYNGLIHLDIKVPGADRRVLDLLDEMDLLGHVATVNDDNAEALLADPRIRPLPSQGALIHGSNDYDADAVAQLLSRPTKGTLLVDDTRCAAALLARSAPRSAGAGLDLTPLPPHPVPQQPIEQLLAIAADPSDGRLTRRQALARLILHHADRIGDRLVYLAEHADPGAPGLSDGLWALARLSERAVPPPGAEALILRMLSDAEREPVLEAAADAAGAAKLRTAVPLLVRLLDRHPPIESFITDEPDRTAAARRIRLRAAAAKALGRIGLADATVIQHLRHVARRRSLHVDGSWQGLDGAEAVKALAALAPARSVDLFRLVTLEIDPQLTAVESRDDLPWWLGRSKAWWDFRIKTEALSALGRAATPQARAALESFLDLPDDRAQAHWRELHWDAARALCAGSAQAELLQPEVLRRLLIHPTSGVRRAGAVYLMAHRDPQYEPLIAEFLPWAANAAHPD